MPNSLLVPMSYAVCFQNILAHTVSFSIRVKASMVENATKFAAALFSFAAVLYTPSLFTCCGTLRLRSLYTGSSFCRTTQTGGHLLSVRRMAKMVPEVCMDDLLTSFFVWKM